MKRPQSVATDAEPTFKPKLRFPEFRDGPAWKGAKVDEIVDIVVPPKKLQTSAYSVEGAFPIVDQSQTEICGWTDDQDALVEDNLPLIVFGDHTCVLKLVARPFAQGADGIKILSARPAADTQFLFQSLSFRPVTTEEYKRHFSILKERVVFFPEAKTGEQQRIAECLSTLDELIGAESQKLDALKAHKKGLMQQLFPREGETLPRLRFPEFRKEKTWRERKISDILAKASLPIDVELEKLYREIGIRSHGRGVFHKEPVTGASIGEKRVFHVVEDSLVLNIVFAWEQAVATTSRNEVGMIASHRFPMYVPKADDCDVRFIKYTLLTPWGKHLLGVASPGGAGRNRTLGQDQFEVLKVFAPDKDEQTKIANIIAASEALLVTQATRLEALKTHKQGLMQQLFSSPLEAER